MESGVTLGFHRLEENSRFYLNANLFTAFLLLRVRNMAYLVNRVFSHSSESHKMFLYFLLGKENKVPGSEKVGWFPFLFFGKAKDPERKPLKAFY